MHDELEARIHRALRALPAPQAPPTLAPRVMRAVSARVPAWWRAVGLAGAIAAGVLLAVALPWLVAAAGWEGAAAGVLDLAAGTAQLVRATGQVWRLAEPVVAWAAAVVFVTGALAAGCGLALGRVVLQREG